MGIVFGGTGVSSGRTFLSETLQGGGSTFTIPSGTWRASLNKYLVYQELDQVTGAWRNAGAPGSPIQYLDSDGVNFRIANQTGCVVGATVTSGGSGYTSAPTVAVNSGGAAFVAVLGPYVSAGTVGNGGTGYTYAPNVVIQNPPTGGVPATAKATISGGVVSAITITDNGAGYNGGTPGIAIVNDPRDTTGSGATATATLTGSGQVVALICTNHGTSSGISTAGTLPTITFTGGGGTSAAATPIMAWTVTGIGVTTSGSGYPTNTLAFGYSVASGTAQYTNPTIQSNYLLSRPAAVGVTISGGQLTTTATIYDAGINAQLPSMFLAAGVSGSGSGGGVITATVGATDDTFLLYPV